MMAAIRGIWTRWLSGDGMRPSRFHNYQGELLDLAGFCYLPQCLLSTLVKKLSGRRPEMPWLGYRAIRSLDRLIKKDWQVLEYGSGMSSLWLAGRCRWLVSVEHDQAWSRFLREELARRGAGNVDYQVLTEERYPEMGSYPDHSFDLVLIDGIRRDEAAGTALRKVKPGGYIYLDNSDVPYPEYQRARQRLLGAARRPRGFRFFNDLCPTHVAVTQGLLIQTPESSRHTPCAVR